MADDDVIITPPEHKHTERPPHFFNEKSRSHGGSLVGLRNLSEFLRTDHGEDEVDVTGDVGTQQVRLLGKIHAHEREQVFVSRLRGVTSRLDVCFYAFFLFFLFLFLFFFFFLSFPPLLSLFSSLFFPTQITLPIEYETFPPKRPDTGGMQSLKKLYRIGLGPSSSHTMGPRRAAEKFAQDFPDHDRFAVKLYGSLAATGKGHLTDIAIIGGLPKDSQVDLEWAPHEVLPTHTNGMRFRALGEVSESGKIDEESGRIILGEYICYSVGGGSIVDHDTVGGPPGSSKASVYDVYDMYTMNEMLEWCEENGEPLSAIAWQFEGDELKEHLGECWDVMMESIERGLVATGALPGILFLPNIFFHPLPNLISFFFLFFFFLLLLFFFRSLEISEKGLFDLS